MSENNLAPFCFLNVYKPKGITSFDVIYKLRKHLKIKKIGHSGTLDPLADGVMQVGIGNTSRLIEYLNSNKTYIAEIQFGYTSTTLDMEGEITKLEEISFSKNDLEETIKKFIGKITQVPPKFSAIKVNGQKLCDIARKNPEKEIEIPEREVEIYQIKLIDFKINKATIEVSCSKGTYIRTLASDIAKNLNTDAYLTKLTRTKAGNFELKNSINIEDVDIKKDGINPIDALELEKYYLDDTEFNLVKNGVAISPKEEIKTEVIMLIYNNKLVSIGNFIDNKIKIKKYFN